MVSPRRRFRCWLMMASAFVAVLCAWELAYNMFASAPGSTEKRGGSLMKRLRRGGEAITRLPTTWLLEPAIDIASAFGMDCVNGEPTTVLPRCPSACVINHRRIRGRVAIAGLTRNNRWDLPRVRDLIEQLGCAFEDFAVVLVENDSNDGTKQFIRRWARQDRRVTLLSKNYHLQKRPSHAFMGEMRNKYLEVALTGGFEYMLALDMDMLDVDVPGFTQAVLSTTETQSWDALSANGMMRGGRYYDTFAFRNQEIAWNSSDGIMFETTKGTHLAWLGQRRYSPTDPPFPVESAFGGMTLYRVGSIGECRYSAPDDDCEHVALNRCIIENNGMILVHPGIVAVYELWCHLHCGQAPDDLEPDPGIASYVSFAARAKAASK